MSYNNEFMNLNKLHSYNQPQNYRNDEEIISKSVTSGFYKEREEPRINSSHGERKNNEIEFSSRRNRMSSTNIVDSNSFNFSKNTSNTGLTNVELARKEVRIFL